jgi:RecB family exonuclease
MEHVDAVWGQIPFRTPWSSGQERAAVEAALGRYLRWQTSNPRTYLGSEERFDVDLEVGGAPLRLHGYADRVELDTEGRVVVVDFKTSKNPPRVSDVEQNAQLGLYQLATEAGAFDHLLDGERATVGGAELVQLRAELAGGAVKVQEQPPQRPDETGRRTVELQLEDAVRRVREEDFPATAGEHCRYCAFTQLCPAKTRGTVLS